MITTNRAGQPCITRRPVTAVEHLEQAIVLGRTDRIAFWEEEVRRERENHRPTSLPSAQEADQ